MAGFVFKPAAMSRARRIATVGGFATLIGLEHSAGHAYLALLVLAALAIHSSNLFLQVTARGFALLRLNYLLFIFSGGPVRPESVIWLLASLVALLAPGWGPLRSVDAIAQFNPLFRRRLFLVGCCVAMAFAQNTVFMWPDGRFSWPDHVRLVAPGLIAAVGVFGVLRMRTWGVLMLATLVVYHHAHLRPWLCWRESFSSLFPFPPDTFDSVLPVLGPVLVIVALLLARLDASRRRIVEAARSPVPTG